MLVAKATFLVEVKPYGYEWTPIGVIQVRNIREGLTWAGEYFAASEVYRLRVPTGFVNPNLELLFAS